MRRILLTAGLTLLAIEIAGLLVLARTDLGARFDTVPAAAFDQLGRDGALQSLADTGFVRGVLPDSVVSVEQILRWTMNLAHSVENPGPVESARRVYEIASSGGGLVCGHLARLFSVALAARGHTAREIQLARSLFSDTDTHITVEVLVEGEWVVYDPTFHLTHRAADGALGAAGIHAALRDGTADRIEPAYLGPVSYPARIESYYMDWLPLYNTVMIHSAGGGSALAPIPPFRYWLGPRWYVLDSDPGALWHVGVGDALYFFCVAFIPLGLLVVAATLGAATAFRRFARSPKHPAERSGREV